MHWDLYVVNVHVVYFKM